MKKRILSLVVTLVLAVSVLLGASLTSSAAEGDGLKDSAISLAENVTLKMEVAIAALTDGAYAKISVPCKDGVKVDTTQLVATAPKAGDNYVFYAEVAVKDLAKNVTIEICNADGTTLVAAATTSALAYCNKYLTDYATGEFVGLVNALKAYANAADHYFDAAKNADDAVVADFSGVEEAKMEGTLPEGITHRSATLLLESETTIRHYFQLDEGKTVEDYTFFVGNDEVTPETKTLAGGVVYYIDIEGLTPNMLDDVYTVKVTDGTDTYTCAYSALTYAKRVYANANSDNDTKNLAAAILAYNSEASGLKGTIIFNVNGGTPVDNQTYDYGVAKPISAPTTKENAIPLGWYADEALTQPIDEVPANAVGEFKVYAKWADISSTKTVYDASKYSDVTRSYCNNHKDTSDPADGICDVCGYCVDNPECTLGNTSATAACTKCGNERLGAAAFNDFAGMKASATDLGHGYAKKITDSSDKEVMMFGVFKTIMNLNYIVGKDNAGLASSAGKIFALTVEVGLPTEEQYSEVEVAPSKPLDDKDGAFYFRFWNTDEVFHVKDGKAYISGDSSKFVTLPSGKVTKLTVVFDFTGAVAGDGVADPYTVALYDEDGSLVNEENATLNNGDISKYSTKYLFQFRTNSDGRFLLGDIGVIVAN